MSLRHGGCWAGSVGGFGAFLGDVGPLAGPPRQDPQVFAGRGQRAAQERRISHVVHHDHIFPCKRHAGLGLSLPEATASALSPAPAR